jgi:hypothetical protein
MFELGKLSNLARSVARTDPKTGEKINKLRKSYEGKIKDLQIAGKPKAVRMDHCLMMPLETPDEDYYQQRVNGREIDNAFDKQRGQLTSSFASLLDSAIAGMAPGPLPPQDAQTYRGYLPTDDMAKSKAPGSAAPSRGVPAPSAPPTPRNQNVSQRAARPERSGAKRSYTDSSFQGYADGFADDGYADSAGDDDGQGNMKKRRLGLEKPHHSLEVGGARR